MLSAGEAPAAGQRCGPSSRIEPVVAENLEPVDLGGGKPMRGEAGEDARRRAPLLGLQLDHRAVFAGDFGVLERREPRRGHPQRPEQHAQRVEMMDQHFRDQHALFPAHEGLPLQRRAQSVRSRQHARGEQGQLRLLDMRRCGPRAATRPRRGSSRESASSRAPSGGSSLRLRRRVRSLPADWARAASGTAPASAVSPRRAAPAAHATRGALRYRWRRVRIAASIASASA